MNAADARMLALAHRKITCALEDYLRRVATQLALDNVDADVIDELVADAERSAVQSRRLALRWMRAELRRDHMRSVLCARERLVDDRLAMVDGASPSS